MLPFTKKTVTLKTWTVFPVSGVVPSIVRTTFIKDSDDDDDDYNVYDMYAFCCLFLRWEKKSAWQSA